MQYCNNCQVKIRGNREECPLCGNVLLTNDDVNQKIYPVIPPAYEAHLAVKIMVFISISAVIASFAAYIIFPSDINWPLFVVLGMGSMWASLIMVIRKRNNIAKNIMWQVTIVSVLSIIWDWRTGWRGWSFNYVIPAACTVAMFVMYVVAKIMKLRVNDYIVYLLLDGLFGIMPVLFILFGWANVFYPSVICAAISIIFISAIFIFQGDNIKIELNKRMHI